MNREKRLISSYSAVILLSIFLLPHGRAIGETLQVNGFEMYYETIGQGEPLILLHGFLQSGDTWNSVSGDFAEHFQVIIPDLRGHGASTNPDESFIAIRQLALDTYALLDHLGIDTVKAMGISMGGETLLHMATQQPDRIEAMVLIGTANYWPYSAREIMRNTDPYNMPEERMRELRKVHKHGDEQIISLMEGDRLAADDYDDMNFTSPYLSTIRAETLIVHGERDRRFPINIAVEMYKAIPESFLWIVPNGGHVPIFGSNQEYFVNTAKSLLLGEMVQRRDKTID